MLTFQESLTFKQAEQYLFDLIPKDDKAQFPGEIGFVRIVELMKLLGDPQFEYPVIHIAGTSGKGSTTYLCSHMLKAAGYKVGLNISPHVVSIRERIQVDNEMISKEDFARVVSKLKPQIEEFSKGEYGHASFFDVVVAVTCEYFKEQKVDVAVIETGLGGTLDGTNVVNSLVSIITPIGFDHEKILGSTISQIAENKAGIIKRDNKLVVSAHQRLDARKVIIDTAAEKGVPTMFLGEEFSIHEYRTDENGVQFNYTKASEDVSMRDLKIPMAGKHQAENAACAITAVLELGEDFAEVDEDAIRAGLADTRVPGRFEIFTYRGKKVVLDGAHNPDKMIACVNTVKEVYAGKNVYCLFGVKKGKNLAAMVELLKPVVKGLAVTQFWKETDMGQRMGEEATQVAGQVEEAGIPVLFINDHSPEAFEKLVESVNESDIILVTGSLFLVSEVREHIMLN